MSRLLRNSLSDKYSSTGALEYYSCGDLAYRAFGACKVQFSVIAESDCRRPLRSIEQRQDRQSRTFATCLIRLSMIYTHID
ncbi:hypothetical protein A0H81_02153 [Grifola frondosa]|uniref:Uncharacterized protein n=1 Tax=Grifola frondosa TaxID=5627 RepID=A0A1C7MLV0_GRIFR|nr:hypothetical protein A0H81_02153 [Grifola frondosa]